MSENKLEYAFTWLTEGNSNKVFDLVQQQVQSANPILGAIEFEVYDCTKGGMPQKYESAWTAVEGLLDASYKPLITIGRQQSRGTNYWFISEQTLINATPTKHIVTIAINEFSGNYTPVNGSIVRIF